MRRTRILVVAIAVLALLALACGSTGGSSSSAPKAPTATPSLVEKVYSGRGDRVVDVSDITGQPYTTAEITHNGKSNFIVKALDEDNESAGLLVNEIGRYDGSVTWEPEARRLQVKADGAWKITVSR